MRKKVKLRFGGLWAPVRSKPNERPIRPALLFLGDTQVVRLDYRGPKKIMRDELLYMIEGDQLIMESQQGDEDERPLIRVKWRLVDDRLLEFSENGITSLWEPVRAEELAREGYPIEIFESYRKAFLDVGSFYTIEGLAPHPSALEAIKKQSIRGRKK